MTDTPIRTHADCVRTAHLTAPFTLVPADWEPGTPVLVIAGLPEGAELRRLCDVPEGWEWQNDAGNWHPAHRFSAEDECTGYVLCRPKPVPAPPDTAREIAAERDALVARLHQWASEWLCHLPATGPMRSAFRRALDASPTDGNPDAE